MRSTAGDGLHALFRATVAVFFLAAPTGLAVAAPGDGPQDSRAGFLAICRAALGDARGSVTLADAATGELLCRWPDRESTAPAGSLVKVFLFLAAASKRPELLDAVAACAPSSPGVPSSLACWYRPGHGVVGFRAGLAHSCQRMAALLAREVSARELVETMGRFGLSVPTEIASRAGGRWMTGHDPGLRFPPEALLAALAAVVDGGLVRELGLSGGRPRRRVELDDTLVAAVREGLRLAAESGTARSVKVPGAMAKTGTSPGDGPAGRAGTEGCAFVYAHGKGRTLAVLAHLEKGAGADAAALAGAVLRGAFGLLERDVAPLRESRPGSVVLSSRQRVRIGLFRLLSPSRVTLASPERGRLFIRGATESRSVELGPDGVVVEAGPRGVEVSGGTVERRAADEVFTVPGRYLLGSPGVPERAVDGQVTITREAGRLRVVVDALLEQVAAGAAARELIAGVPEEAAKAQLVACRSYALAHLGRHAREGFDLCDSTHCQLWSGSEASGAVAPGAMELAARAARATESLALGWRGEPVEAFYSADCGGWLALPADLWSRDGGPCRAGAGAGSGEGLRSPECGPYAGGADPWCGGSEASRWTLRLRRSELLAGVLEEAPERPEDWSLSLETSGPPGSPSVRAFVAVSGERRERRSFTEVSRSLRERLGRWALRSRRFELRMDGPDAVLEGRGFGHSAGLCQRGATGMARAGKDFREILQFYYPGASLSRR